MTTDRHRTVDVCGSAPPRHGAAPAGLAVRGVVRGHVETASEVLGGPPGRAVDAQHACRRSSPVSFPARSGIRRHRGQEPDGVSTTDATSASFPVADHDRPVNQRGGARGPPIRGRAACDARRSSRASARTSDRRWRRPPTLDTSPRARAQGRSPQRRDPQRDGDQGWARAEPAPPSATKAASPLAPAIATYGGWHVATCPSMTVRLLPALSPSLDAEIASRAASHLDVPFAIAAPGWPSFPADHFTSSRSAEPARFQARQTENPKTLGTGSRPAATNRA